MRQKLQNMYNLHMHFLLKINELHTHLFTLDWLKAFTLFLFIYRTKKFEVFHIYLTNERKGTENKVVKKSIRNEQKTIG